MMYNRYNNTNQKNNNQPQQNNHTSQFNSEKFNFQNNSKLQSIDPVKLKIIMEIQKKSKNTSMEELFPEIMKINQELNRRNMGFTKNETSILLEVIEENLSPEEKKKFEMIKGFMNM